MSFKGIRSHVLLADVVLLLAKLKVTWERNLLRKITSDYLQDKNLGENDTKSMVDFTGKEGYFTLETFQASWANIDHCMGQPKALRYLNLGY